MSIALTVQAMTPGMVPTRFSKLVQQVRPLSSRRCAAPRRVLLLQLWQQRGCLAPCPLQAASMHTADAGTC